MSESITTESLAIGITRPDDEQRLLARERIQSADHLGLRNAAWLGGIRAGKVGTSLADLNFTISGGPNVGADRFDGVTVEVSENGSCYRQHFKTKSLSAVALRAAVPLYKSEVLKQDEDFHFYVVSMPRADSVARAVADQGMRVRARHEPLVVERVDLKRLIDASQPLEGTRAEQEPTGAPPFPIFTTEDVWRQTRQIARRGGENESAGIITGRLVRDTDTPELAVMLDACLEAKHALEEKLSVTMSGADWSDFHKFLALRRRRVNPHEVMTASVHGHNFLPAADASGRRMCDACATAKVCGRTTASASLADERWHQIVFSEYPWATLLIWGYNARQEDDWRLYGLGTDGTLSPRPLRLLKS